VLATVVSAIVGSVVLTLVDCDVPPLDVDVPSLCEPTVVSSVALPVAPVSLPLALVSSPAQAVQIVRVQIVVHRRMTAVCRAKAARVYCRPRARGRIEGLTY